MHVVVVNVKVSDPEGSVRQLREKVAPAMSQAPGFVTGYWTRKENTGLSMVVFDSEDAANGAKERVPGMLPDGVTLESLEVREVVAHA